MKKHFTDFQISFLFAPLLLFILDLSAIDTGFIENCGQIQNQYGNKNRSIQYILPGSKKSQVQVTSSGLAYEMHWEDASGKLNFRRMDVGLVGSTDFHFIPGEGEHEVDHRFIKSDHEIESKSYRKLIGYGSCNSVMWELIADENHGFKHNFHISPALDLTGLQLIYSGFDSVYVMGNSVKFFLGEISISEYIPQSWYYPSGENIEINYKIIQSEKGRLILGFTTESEKNLNEQLIIDPAVEWEWGTYYGGAGNDVITGLSVDSLGNLMVCGVTSSVVTMASEGSFQGVFSGGQFDAFISRFNQHGLRQWSTYFGGTGKDLAKCIEVDRYQNIYVGGVTTSPDSTASDSCYQPVFGGNVDGFIAAFSRHGQRLWSTYLGGAGADTITHISIADPERIFVGGHTDTPGWLGQDSLVPQLAYSGLTDGFISEFNPQGEMVWCSYAGGTGDDKILSVAADTAGRLALAGVTNSANGLAFGMINQNELEGQTDGWIALFDTAQTLYWSSYFGTTLNDEINDVLLLGDSIYLCGNTRGKFTFQDSIFTTLSDTLGNGEAFLAKFSTESEPIWFTYLGGTGRDSAVALASDYGNQIYIAGFTEGADTLLGHNSHQPESQGLQDAFVARFSGTGELEWSAYHGGEGRDKPTALAVHGFTAIYFAGTSESTSGMIQESPWEEVHQPSANDSTESFLARFSQVKSTPPFAVGPGGGSGYGSDGGGVAEDPRFGVCLGDSLLIGVQGGCLGVGAEWVWYRDTCGATDLYIGEGEQIWVSPLVTTDYFVRAESVQDVSACGHIRVHVDTLPEATVQGPDTVCLGSSASFVAEGAHSYWWYRADTLFTEGQEIVIDSVFSEEDLLLIAESEFGCTDSVNISLSVYQSPQGELTGINPTCYNSSDGQAQFSSNDSLLADFFWSYNGSADSVLTDLPGGNYNVILNSVFGCSTALSISLQSPPPPIDSMGVNNTWCDQSVGSTWVNYSGLSGPYSTTWLPDSVAGDTLYNLPEGIYTAVVVDGVGCTQTDSVYVPNLGFFDISVEPDSVFLEFIDSAEVSVLIPLEIENPIIAWSPQEVFNCPSCESSWVNPPLSGEVWVTVTSAYGCTASDTIWVHREVPLPSAFVPNAFSPNGDGLNDQLCFEGYRVLAFNLQVFNENGELVFTSQSPETCWNGEVNGQAASGQFLYVYEALLDEVGTVRESGSVTILR